MSEELVIAPGYITIPGYVNQIADMLYQLQQQGVMCDVRLQGEDGHVMAHAPVLSAASPLLKRSFTGSEVPVENPLLNERVEDLHNFIRLVYTGKLFLSFSNIPRMARLLKKLEIHDIAQTLSEYSKEKSQVRGTKRKRTNSFEPESEPDLNSPISNTSMFFSENTNTDPGFDVLQDKSEDDDSVHSAQSSQSDCDGDVNEQVDFENEEEISESSEIMQTKQVNFDVINYEDSEVMTVKILDPAAEPESELSSKDEDKLPESQDSDSGVQQVFQVMDSLETPLGNEEATALSGNELSPKVQEKLSASQDLDSSVQQVFSVMDSPETSVRKQEVETLGRRTSPRFRNVNSNIETNLRPSTRSSKQNKLDKSKMYVVLKKGDPKKEEIDKKIEEKNGSSMGKKTDKKNDNKTYKCVHCQRMFRKSHYWLAHQEKCKNQETKTRDWSMYRRKESCDLCTYTTYVKCYMARHKYIAHGIDFDRTKFQVFKCEYPECGYFHMDKTNIRKHVRSKHIDEQLCETCGKVFCSKFDLEMHMQAHLNATKEDLQSRLNTTEDDVQGIFQCTFCLEKFIDVEMLQDCNFFHLRKNRYEQHVREKHGKPSFTCDECGNTFTSRSQLKQHKITHIPREKRHFKHKCEICKLTFRYRSLLMNHVKVKHNKEKSYLCHLCPYETAYKREIDIHMFKVHEVPLPENRKKFECTLCDYFSFFKRDLEAHLNRHNGIRNQVCEECGASFTSRNGLIGHMVRHKGKTRCNYEGCTYEGVPQELKKHVYVKHTHKDFKPYCCNVCDFKTKTQGTLTKHLKKAHNLNVVTKSALWENMMKTGEGYGDITYRNRVEALDRAAMTKGNSDEIIQFEFVQLDKPDNVGNNVTITTDDNETVNVPMETLIEVVDGETFVRDDGNLQQISIN